VPKSIAFNLDGLSAMPAVST